MTYSPFRLVFQWTLGKVSDDDDDEIEVAVPRRSRARAPASIAGGAVAVGTTRTSELTDSLASSESQRGVSKDWIWGK